MDPAAEFNLGLHLREGNDEAAAKKYWSNALNMDSPHFGTTYIKPAWTGHRKNQLPHVFVGFVSCGRPTTGTMSWCGSKLWLNPSAARWTDLLASHRGSLAQFGRATDS
jgi:hypothetical protein